MSLGKEFVQALGSGVEEDLAVPADIGSAGFILLQNLDDTAYIQYGLTAGVYTGRMLAGEPALIRLDTGKVLKLKASADCNIEGIVIEL